ncbi:MAG: dihydrofolate reductase [Alistipes sp.]|nr:dihydrofolate reductase [Alistipes sp.]
MVSIIVAIAENGVIGDKNTLLWHIREDMVRFRTTTSGHPVVMGRKTYDSIGRPLPKRTNVVITRDAALQIEGCTVVHSLQEAISLFPSDEEVFIIGGTQIYTQAMEYADRLYLTIVHRPYEGDASFPEIDYSQWRELSRTEYASGESFDAPFTFLDLERIR